MPTKTQQQRLRVMGVATPKRHSLVPAERFGTMRALALRVIGLAALTVALAACKSTTTFRFDERQNGTTTFSVREVMDDEAYNVDMAQSTRDPFELLSDNGFTVTRELDGEGNHSITASLTGTRDELKSRLALIAANNNSPSVLAPTITDVSHGLFTDRTTELTVFPALLSSDSGRWNLAAQAASQGLAVFRLEYKPQGRVVRANGEVLPDGSVRWTLASQRPTEISVVYETTNWRNVRIAIGVTVLLAVVFLIVDALRHRRRLLRRQR